MGRKNLKILPSGEKRYWDHKTKRWLFRNPKIKVKPSDHVPVTPGIYERLLELRCCRVTVFNEHVAKKAGVGYKVIRYIMEHEGSKPIRRDNLHKIARYLRSLVPSKEEQEQQETWEREGVIQK